MAIFDVTYFFKDDFNRRTNRTIQIDAVDAQGAGTHALALANEIQPMLECGLIKFRVALDTDYPTVVIPGANLDAGLTASWELTPLGSEKLAPTTLPGPIAALFDENGNLLTGDPVVIAWAALFTNGPYLISDGEVPADLKKGKLDR